MVARIGIITAVIAVMLITISHYANVFAESGDITEEAEVPGVFSKEDYMTLDKQNYSDGDVVIRTGFIEGLEDGHFLTEIMVHPSGEIRSVNHSHNTSGFFGSGSRIVGSSWEDGIYKIIVSGAGKEFTEIFGVNYALTESDIAKHKQEEQENAAGQLEKKLIKSHVGVNRDTRNYVQGGLVEIFGFVHLNENDQVNPDEKVTIKVYAKNSKIVIHEATASLDEYNEFSYYLDTSDDKKWDYATQGNPPPFGTPRGFYYAVAEYAGLTDETKFSLKATVKQEKELNVITEQANTLQPSAEHADTIDLMQTANYDDGDIGKNSNSYLEWEEDSYSPTGTSVVVNVTDPGRNKDPETVDSFNIGVYSGSVMGTPPLPVTETGKNTGMFEGTIFYTTDKSLSHSNRIFVADGHRITVTYKEDSLLFKPSNATEDELDITDNNNTQKTSENITTFGDIKISNTESIQWINLREELVMIHTTSVEKLFERGYLIDHGLYLQQRNNPHIKTFDPTYQAQPMTKTESQFLYQPNSNDDFDIPELTSKPEIPPNAGPLAGVHEHASILVPIFGDNLDFSKSMFQIKNPYIHFEGNDGTTIHKHAENVTLGFLFETLNMELTDECLTIPDGRYFCNEETDGFSLKFYINGGKVESLSEYVLSDGDRILLSYGFEDDDQVSFQLDELNSQRIAS